MDQKKTSIMNSDEKKFDAESQEPANEDFGTIYVCKSLQYVLESLLMKL